MLFCCVVCLFVFIIMSSPSAQSDNYEVMQAIKYLELTLQRNYLLLKK